MGGFLRYLLCIIVIVFWDSHNFGPKQSELSLLLQRLGIAICLYFLVSMVFNGNIFFLCEYITQEKNVMSH